MIPPRRKLARSLSYRNLPGKTAGYSGSIPGMEKIKWHRSVVNR